ncbi:uncharacterized protein LOC122660269 isoform X2 [Telopea speciosissima]|uniref:uncharacterized protein LOC122660269 isoform X2 n=1 Tax=Telopea speciosissima TaxID=54955 RepID=UPI001CC3616E|nr:uncharacterized protein LOC122660269 isoform X2 [Telopea speciosissima]
MKTADRVAPFSWIFFSLVLISCSVVFSAADEPSIFVAQPITLQLSSGLPVENSPGSKPGEVMVCQRIHIYDLSRLQDLSKYAHSVKAVVKDARANSRGRLPNIEVCFHRNRSLGIGMCTEGEWEKLTKGLWIRAMPPYMNNLLDIRMPGPSFEVLEVSIEEELLLYRVIFLVLGIALMTLAPDLSMSIMFYYSSAMAVGIILVILMILFQGMKLLPTGRKNSLGIFIYSSIVGLGSFLLYYLRGLSHSILVEMGITKDMYKPLVIFLLVCIVLTGAWLAFWAVHKLVLTKDGSIDTSIAHLVAWSIRIFAAIMIYQSSLDPILAAEALVSGIIISSTMRRIVKSRFISDLYKRKFRTSKNKRRRFQIQDSPAEDSCDEYVCRTERLAESESYGTLTKPFTLASCNSPLKGVSNASWSSDSETYYSTFHQIPQRQRYPKDELDSVTKDFTKKALEELFSSPDFNNWAVAHAERITLTPSKDQSSTSERRRGWFSWFK